MSKPTKPPTKRGKPRSRRRFAVEELADVLSAEVAGTITADMIRQDLEAGAPQEPDGSIDVVHYEAWLCQRERSK